MEDLKKQIKKFEIEEKLDKECKNLLSSLPQGVDKRILQTAKDKLNNIQNDTTVFK